MPADSVGLYVHVPFCERVCPYCDFAVVAARNLSNEQEQRYVGALVAEIRARSRDFADRVLETVYLGGGTPALLCASSVARILDAARSAFPGEPREVTLEVNPSTLERTRLPEFRDAGVTRLSIGVQSFDDATLRRLGRAHRSEACHDTLQAARAAGFTELSLDLIFGVAGQELPDVMRDVEAALSHQPEHVSAYGLTVEEGTPLARGVARGTIRLPEPDAVAEVMESLAARLAAAGLPRYEISSYAGAGHEARHNRRYWRRQPVLGVGMGAHSTEPAGEGAPFGARSANERQLASYLGRVEQGAFEPPWREPVAAAAARTEAVFLALRAREGLAAADFAREFGDSPRHYYGAEIQELREAGLLSESPDGDLVLTERGWLLSDSVFECFA